MPKASRPIRRPTSHCCRAICSTIRSAMRFDRRRRWLLIVRGDGRLATVVIDRNSNVVAWSLLGWLGRIRSVAMHDGEPHFLVRARRPGAARALRRRADDRPRGHARAAPAPTSSVERSRAISRAGRSWSQGSGRSGRARWSRRRRDPAGAGDLGRPSALAYAHRGASPWRWSSRMAPASASIDPTGRSGSSSGCSRPALCAPTPATALAPLAAHERASAGLFSGEVALRASGWRRGSREPPWRVAQDDAGALHDPFGHLRDHGEHVMGALNSLATLGLNLALNQRAQQAESKELRQERDRQLQAIMLRDARGSTPAGASRCAAGWPRSGRAPAVPASARRAARPTPSWRAWSRRAGARRRAPAAVRFAHRRHPTQLRRAQPPQPPGFRRTLDLARQQDRRRPEWSEPARLSGDSSQAGPGVRRARRAGPPPCRGPLATVTFSHFVISWNLQQGRATPDVHQRMAAWLDERWAAGDRRLLLMVFRDAGKSTLVGLFCAWLLGQDPESAAAGAFGRIRPRHQDDPQRPADHRAQSAAAPSAAAPARGVGGRPADDHAQC